MIEALCWTLIHSLWQGLIFGIVTGLVMLCTRRSTAATRYGIVCGLFLLFLASCACTFGWEWGQLAKGTDGSQYPVPVFGGGWVSWMTAISDYLSVHASFIVMLWCLLLGARSVRMLWGVLYMQRIRNSGAAPPAYWTDKIISLCGQVGIGKTVQLLESHMARMPMVIGHLKPVILIPLGLLARLPEGEIEAVLLHELAHIRRNDYLINFLQHLAENLFFFNPGLRWMSAILREERESCCDDLAIAETNDKAQFIQALVSFKEYALQVPAYAPAFPAKKNQLLYRTMRIVHDRNKTLNPSEKIFFLGSWIVLLCLFVAWTNGPIRSLAQDKPEKERGISNMPYSSGIDKRDNNDPGQAPGEGMDTSGVEAGNGTAERNEQGTDAPLVRREKQQSQPGAEERRSDEPQAGTEEARSDEPQAGAEEARSDEQQVQADAEAARMDAQVAQADAEQARKDALQAQADALQAKKDAEQARKDAQQVLTEAAAQAKRDKQEAEREAAVQARTDAEQASRDRKQAVQDRKQAIRDREQAEKDREQMKSDSEKTLH